MKKTTLSFPKKFSGRMLFHHQMRLFTIAIIVAITATTTAIPTRSTSSSIDGPPNILLHDLSLADDTASKRLTRAFFFLDFDTSYALRTYRCSPSGRSNPDAGRCRPRQEGATDYVAYRIREPIPQLVVPYPFLPRDETRQWFEDYVDGLQPMFTSSFLLDIYHVPME